MTDNKHLCVFKWDFFLIYQKTSRVKWSENDFGDSNLQTIY